MGQLEKPRHELMAQGLFQGKTINQAYADAGYIPNHGAASRLAKHVKIVARLAELHSRTIANVNLSKEWIIEQLIAVVQECRSYERIDSAGANKALNLLGLELGMYVERKEVGKPGEFDGLTIAGKKERILGIAQQLGLHRIAPGERLPADAATIDATADTDT